MKTLFAIILVALSFQLMAQTDSIKHKPKLNQDDLYYTPEVQETPGIENFKSVDNLFIWQKVYSTNLSFNKLSTKFIDSGIIGGLVIDENKISGDLKGCQFDGKSVGYSRASTPMYLLNDLLSGYVTIDFKEGRYRVTVKMMTLTSTFPSPTLLGIVEPAGTVVMAEDMVFKNSKKNMGKFKDSFWGVQSKIWNYTLESKFQIKDKEDNW